MNALDSRGCSTTSPRSSQRSATSSTSSWCPRCRDPRTSTTSTGSGPARGPCRPAAPDSRARDPRDGSRCRERRADRRGQPPHAGHVAGPGRPRRRPPHEDDPGGGGHPGYLVRQDPVDGDIEGASSPRQTYQQDLWHYTIAHGRCLRDARDPPVLRPFEDIADVVACEDQFRNAFLLGCVGTWSLHPAQIAIAKRVFSPSAEDVAHARRVVAAMGDGTGAVMLDGKMEDDASLKQCLVIVELAERLAQTGTPSSPSCMPPCPRTRGRAVSSAQAAYRPRRCPYRPCPPRTSGRWRRPRPSPSTGSSSTSRTRWPLAKETARRTQRAAVRGAKAT